MLALCWVGTMGGLMSLVRADSRGPAVDLFVDFESALSLWSMLLSLLLLLL